MPSSMNLPNNIIPPLFEKNSDKSSVKSNCGLDTFSNSHFAVSKKVPHLKYNERAEKPQAAFAAGGVLKLQPVNSLIQPFREQNQDSQPLPILHHQLFLY